MGKLIAIDSNVFIWGIKQQASQNQEYMIAKTKAFLELQWKEGTIIIIPAPVIGEILTPIPFKDHGSILTKIDRTMLVAPFDLIAAARFAEMMQKYHHDKGLNEYKNDHKIPRERIKVDYMIAAIAVSRKAQCIYSEDAHFTTFARSFIDVREVPEVGIQTVLTFEKPKNNVALKPSVILPMTKKANPVATPLEVSANSQKEPPQKKHIVQKKQE